MSIVKVGIIGIGNMGRSYVLQLDQGLVDGARVNGCLWSEVKSHLNG